MEDLEKTIEIIPISVLKNILCSEYVYDNFINRRGEFAEDITKYIEPLNEFMQIFQAKAIELDEVVFDRINTINNKFGGNKRFEYMEYLLNTIPMVSIYDIEQILSDEETFNNFLDFNNHRNWFPLDLVNYLAALDDYFGYFKKTNISIGSLEQSRFNRIKLKYILEYRRIFLIKGREAKESIAPELEKEILSCIDFSKSKFNIARQIYVELNKRCTYSVSFLSYDQDLKNKKAKAIYDGKVKKNKDKYEIVCSSWSEIYAHLLNSCGIEAKVCNNNGIHTFVDFDCDGTYMRADGTSDFLGEDGLHLNDVIRCQMGFETVGFRCLEPDKDISYVLQEADQEIGVKYQDKNSILLSYANEYRRRYMYEKNVSTYDKVSFLMGIAISSSLENLELFKYINLLYETIFTEEERSQMGRNYVAINKDRAGFVISYIKDNGKFESVVFGKYYNKKYSAKGLKKLINRGKITLLGHNKKIFGLEGEVENGKIR